MEYEKHTDTRHHRHTAGGSHRPGQGHEAPRRRHKDDHGRLSGRYIGYVNRAVYPGQFSGTGQY